MAHFTSPLSRYHYACRCGLQVDVCLGTSAVGQCLGHSICSLQLGGQTVAAAGCSPTLPGFLRLDPATHRLLLHLETVPLSPRLLRRHFTGGCLTVHSPYALPPAIVCRLALAMGSHLIVAGRYPVLDDGTFLTTSLRLAREQALQRPAA